MFDYILDEGASCAVGSCLGVGTNFNPRLRTSSSQILRSSNLLKVRAAFLSDNFYYASLYSLHI